MNTKMNILWGIFGILLINIYYELKSWIVSIFDTIYSVYGTNLYIGVTISTVLKLGILVWALFLGRRFYEMQLKQTSLLESDVLDDVVSARKKMFPKQLFFIILGLNIVFIFSGKLYSLIMNLFEGMGRAIDMGQLNQFYAWNFYIGKGMYVLELCLMGLFGYRVLINE